MLKGKNNNFPSLLALEEPEAHLHPTAIRAISELIQNLPSQTIVTSHSGDFISSVPLTSIRRVYKKNGETFIGRISDNKLEPREINSFEFNIKCNKGSFLFSDYWILVEGESDYLFVSSVLSSLRDKLTNLSYSIITIARFGGSAPYVKIAESLGIIWFLFVDGDDSGKNYIQNAIKASENYNIDEDRIVQLEQKCLEYFLWDSGFSDVFENIVGDKYINALKLKNISNIQDAILETKKIKENKFFIANEIANKIKISNNIPEKFSDLINKINKTLGSI
jgi:putative ATP-dependent endonuclease of OLD family